MENKIPSFYEIAVVQVVIGQSFISWESVGRRNLNKQLAQRVNQNTINPLRFLLNIKHSYYAIGIKLFI